jgi:hypothetical protein
LLLAQELELQIDNGNIDKVAENVTEEFANEDIV